MEQRPCGRRVRLFDYRPSSGARSQTVDDTGSRVRLQEAMREEARRLLTPGRLARGERCPGVVATQAPSRREMELLLELVLLQAKRAVLAISREKSEIDKLELQSTTTSIELTRAQLRNEQLIKQIRLLEYHQRKDF